MPAFRDIVRDIGVFAPLIAILAVPTALYAGVLGTASWNQSKLIYRGAGRAMEQPQSGWRLEALRTKDHGALHSYLLPGLPGRPAVVFLHGNYGGHGTSIAATRLYSAMGMTVLVPEYPGYGGNAGKPSENGMTDAAVSAVDRIAASGFPASRIFLVGNSLGSTPALEAANQRELGGVVTISGYSRMTDMVRETLPMAPSFLLSDPMDNLEAASELKVPRMIVHGRDDDYVPLVQGRRLAEAARTPLTLVSGGHSTAYAEDTQRKVAEWILSKASRQATSIRP
jgi:pimeloyl-ACP methyl ester carboxylesterase